MKLEEYPQIISEIFLVNESLVFVLFHDEVEIKNSWDCYEYSNSIFSTHPAQLGPQGPNMRGERY